MTELIDKMKLLEQIAEFGREIPKDQVIGVITRQESVGCDGDLIRREEATSIPILPKEHRKVFNGEDDAFETGWNEALACVNMLPSADRPKGEWIPVSEKPKDEKRTYLVQLDGSGMCSCRWTNVNPFWTDLTTEWHWNTFDIPLYCKVVAWMDLEPYKGGEDE